MYECMYVCIYVCVFVCMYECLYVCLFVCMYVYMYVCAPAGKLEPDSFSVTLSFIKKKPSSDRDRDRNRPCSLRYINSQLVSGGGERMRGCTSESERGAKHITLARSLTGGVSLHSGTYKQALISR